MKITHKDQNGFTIIEILIVVVVLGIVGFVGWKFMDSKQQNTSQLNNQAVLPESLADIKPIDEIIALAASEIGTRQVLAAELEQEDEGLVYLIKLSDGTVLVFDAKTGNKVQLKSNDSAKSDEDKPLPVGFKPVVTIAAAVQTAKTQRVGKAVEKVELEVEDGIVVYSVRFGDDGRVDIDATTGNILRIREPGKSDVKLRDTNNDVNDDSHQNSQGTVDHNDDINDADDNDSVDDSADDSDDDSSNSGSGSSNSGSN